MKLPTDRMAFIVEMVRSEDSIEASFFALSGPSWNTLLELATAHGWQPSGATYDDDPRLANHEDAGKPTDYKPEEWSYAKRVSATDAAALAEALMRARDAVDHSTVPSYDPLVLSDDLPIDELRTANASLPGAVDEFIEFAAADGFIFAWDD